MSFRRQQHNRDDGSNDNHYNRHRHRSSDNSGTSRNTTTAGGTSRAYNRFGRSWSTRSAHSGRNNNRSDQNDNRSTLASTPRRATSARTMNHQRNTTSSSTVGNAHDTTNTTNMCSDFVNECDDGSNGASSCVICMDELKGRLGVANPCGHVFHQECYGSWDVQSFEGSSDDEDDDSTSAGNRRRPTKCPTCRSNITVFTHIHELVGQIQFGEIIPPCLQTATATATTTITTSNGDYAGSSESANRVSPNASDHLSSFIRKNLDDVRGISSLDEGKIVDMEVDSLFAEVSDLRSQVASLESILKSSQEQHEETVRKAHTDQEHLARGMVDLSENNEQLRKELRKVEELYEATKAENTLLRSEVEQGTTVMNELLLRESEHNNSANNSRHYEGYHGFRKHSFT